jgi:hypothetical protein
MSGTFFSRAMIIEYDSVVARLATRAEDLTDLDGTFVETIFPEIMQARAHQIIYGRRGAGKTHLLRHVEGSLHDSFSETGILPIYVNGSQLSQGIAPSDPVTVALAVYVQLMQHVGAEIRRFVGELNQANFWDRLVGGGKSQTARQADEIANVLQETLISGQVRLLPSGEVSDEATTLAETSRNSSIGASVKVDPRSLGWAVQAGTTAGKHAKFSSSMSRKTRGEVILPFAQVSSDLVRLLELLDNASIHILFDEWSEIDKDPRVQPYLAEMLRRTTSAVPGMYLKLACIPGRTSLAIPITEDAKNPIGLEEGDDIHSAVNLDSVIFSGESIGQLAPFFMAMIKKHVGEKLPWVRDSSKAYFESFLMSMVFSGISPFVELCQASGGVPRDFINIYRNATTLTANIAKSSGQTRQPLELVTVRMAAKSVYQSKRASFGKPSSPQLRLLDRIYQEIYVKKHSYLFLLSEESAEDDVVQTLYMEKLIHRLPPTHYNPADESRYQYFQLDYGTTIDRLLSNAVNDARASFESSLWVKLGEIGNKFLGRTVTNDSIEESVYLAAFTALFQAEPGRLDINPRDIVFNLDDKSLAKPRSGGPRGRGRHRR